MSDSSPSDSGADGLAARLRTDRPHSARVWNYILGGKDHYAPDRQAGDLILRAFPEFAAVARTQRRFLARAVRFLTEEAGVRQFLDIGTGLPTADNTHEIAQRAAPDSRIVYVDHDPLVLAHARALLTSTPEGSCDYLEADVRDPRTILAGAARTLDLDRPVGLVLLGIMGQLPDSDNPWGLVDELVEALPPGSHLVLSDGIDTSETLNAAVRAYNEQSADSYHLRPAERIEAFFHGLHLVAPGVVLADRWRAPETAEQEPRAHAMAGVARKP
ncbi:SAM-dependent methyltransferase [Streptomyces sp. NPDC058045]|uniref:SAM-dependent methyltransferase n=1 Tax=Streptomyces sp. NPDC058045 TaxID=3346311 RepID=UPI0036ED23FE